MPSCSPPQILTSEIHLDRGARLRPPASTLVIGDSPACVFFEPIFSGLSPQVLAVKGASAYGLKKSRSITGAGQRFRQALRESNARRAIFLLGGVDTDFLIWHRAENGGRPIRACLEDSLSSYRSFLSEALEERGSVELQVISAPLPIVRDRRKWWQSPNAGRPVQALLSQRTQLALSFNSRMKAFCQVREIGFLDLDPVSIGHDGFVTKTLRGRDKSDHHYRRDRYAHLIAVALELKRQSQGAPLFQLNRIILGALCAALILLSGCVTTRTGERKFDPWKAALRTDDKIDDWLEGMGYPTSRHAGF